MTATRTPFNFNERQKSVIDAALQEFSFSTNPQELKQQIIHLRSALAEKADTDTPFYWLGECINYPRKFFQELVLHEGEACTRADVKEYILNHVHSQIAAAANTANVSLKDLAWDYTQVIKERIKDKDKKIFKRGKAREEGGDNPWQPPPIEGKIYTRAIRETIDRKVHGFPEKHIYVDVKVTYNPNISYSDSFWIGKVPYFSDNDEGRIKEFNFFANAHALADKKALNYATENVIRWLSPSAAIKKKLLDQIATQKIITHQYYFDLLKTKSINVQYFLDSTEQQADAFTEEKLILLVQKNICAYSDMKSITPAQKKVAIHPLYYGWLNNKSLEMKTIRDLNDFRCQLLIHPFITNLIQLKKLTFADVIAIPRHVTKLFTSRLYQSYFQQNIPLQPLSALQEHHIELMLNPEFSNLVTSNKISLEKIISIDKDTANLLKQCPYLINWVKFGIINFDELLNGCEDAQKFFELHINVYAKRLRAIFNTTPFIFDRQLVDSIDLILNELPSKAINCGVSTYNLQEWVIYKFAMELKEDLIKANAKDPTALYDEMLIVLSSNSSENFSNWQSILDDLINLAKNYKQPSSFNIFNYTNVFSLSTLLDPPIKKQKTDKHSDVTTFCSQLIAIEKFTLTLESNTVTYTPQYK